MHHRGHMGSDERAARAQLTKFLHGRELLRGSLITMVHTCGKKSCRCARGEKHRSLYLSIRTEGKRKMIYIPWALEDMARSGVETYRDVTTLMETVSEASLARLVKQKEQLSKNRADKHPRKTRGRQK